MNYARTPTRAGFVLLLVLAGNAAADERVNYRRDVKPLLEARCYACHGPLRQKSQLRLDRVALMLEGGLSGPAIVPGKSGESLLIHALTGTEGATRMPEDGKPLSASQIALVRRWIDQGAQAENDIAAADPRRHWAFQPPRRPPLPTSLSAAADGNPIDRFLAAAQQQRRLKPQPPAAKQVLLRRVYLDLIGLPPTREQLLAFLADESPDAYERVVDRLLTSRQYGERWGRHWMDVWRYTDHYGLGGQVRNSQKHIWHWRDWIIDSLNEDKGYDRMVLEMLAGDEIAAANPKALRGTGYLVRNYYLFNRNVWLDDIVEHTSKAFLGLTVNCARCHDHKYDPIAQTEYYALRAFFEPHRVRTDPLPGAPAVEQGGLPRVYDAEPETPTYLFVRGNEKQPDKETPIAPAIPEFLYSGELSFEPVSLAPEAYYPQLRPEIQQSMVSAAQQDVARAIEALTKARASLEAARTELAAFREASTAQATVDNEKSAESASQQQPASSRPAGKAVFEDDFARERPELWKAKAGDWTYENGRLVQHQVDGAQSRLVAKRPYPQDFEATLRFTITAGKTRSVGMLFDIDGDNYHGVYLSPTGSKIQVYHQVAGKFVYPSVGRQSFHVENGEPYELRFAIRDRLINVWVNGELQIVYRLEHPRRRGQFAITTYQAAAEFTQVSLAPLPAETKLAETKAAEPPAKNTEPSLAAAVVKAQRAVAVAEAKHAVAVASLPAVLAKLAAETAKHRSSNADEQQKLALAAGAAEKRQAVADLALAALTAEHALAAAEAKVQAGQPGKQGPKVKAAAAAAKKAHNEARKKLAAARAALDEPTAKYNPPGKAYPSSSTGRRTALARWIISRDNPLTARVAVNHIWLRHFGVSLVPSVFEFGQNGKPPSHPQLLDWLAVELMDHGWSMKHLHRLMVTSAAYRRSSSSIGVDSATAAADRDNIYLWRMNSRRMESQVVRDSVLLLAGQLDLTMGGPDLPPKQAESTPRRSLYFRHSRDERVPFLTMFDDAAVEECYRRPTSIIPQQALAMSNGKLVLSRAALIAERVAQQLDAESALHDDAAFITAAFQTVLARRPNADELAACTEALAEFTKLPGTKDQAAGLRRARGNLVHVLLNHNDFVTVR